MNASAATREKLDQSSSNLWLYRAPAWQIRLLVVLFTLALFAVNFAADRLLIREWHHPWVMMLASDAAAAVIIGWLVWKLAEYAQERRKRVAQRLQMISELNHHIRNALEAISLSAYTTQNQQAMETIAGAVNRIDWALREILPIAKK